MSEQAILQLAEMLGTLMQNQQSQQTLLMKGLEAMCKQNETLTTNVLRVHSKKAFPLHLDTFDGAQSLPQWIMDVELKAAVNQIPESEFGLWARTALKGLAKQHIERLGLTEWKEIKASLTQRFVPKNLNLVLRSKLLNLHQVSSDISGYIHEFQVLLAQLTDAISQSDLIFYFLKGLRPACKQHVYLQSVASLDEAMQLSLNFENANLSGATMELDALNSLSGPRRNNFTRRPNNTQRNSNYRSRNFQRPNHARNSNFGNRPRSFMNFSRVPSQSAYRNPSGFQRRPPQNNSFNSFRRNGYCQVNNRRFPNQLNRNSQFGGPRPNQPQRFRWRPRTNTQMNCVTPYENGYYESLTSQQQSNFQGAQASGPSL